MSNHPSRSVTRRYAWHFPELMDMLRSIGEQNRIEQHVRSLDRKGQ